MRVWTNILCKPLDFPRKNTLIGIFLLINFV